MIEVNLPGSPLSTNSIYKRAYQGRMYMKKEGHDKRDEYAWQFKSAVKKKKGWKLDATYEVEIHLFFKDNRLHDIDNYNKLVLDAATGIVWNDDSQIVKLTIFKAVDKEQAKIKCLIHML